MQFVVVQFVENGPFYLPDRFVLLLKIQLGMLMINFYRWSILMHVLTSEENLITLWLFPMIQNVLPLKLTVVIKFKIEIKTH